VKKPAYEQVSKAFDRIFFKRNPTEKDRQAARREWLEYLESVGWTETEFEDILEAKVRKILGSGLD